jgi:citrate synthase
MSEVIFEITEDLLESGLRGFPVGYCTSSDVDPIKGLSYVGIPIADLSEKDPVEVIYLLYFGKQGSAAEVQAFKDDLAKRAKCQPSTIEHIRKLPRKGHPMALFTSAILITGMIEGTGNYREDCLNLIAKIPEISATVINHHAGWAPGKPSNPAVGYIENFTQMLNVPGSNEKELNEAFRLFNVLHYDHGGGNLSTFVGKAVASGLEDLYGSIAAAMCALAGPRHGRANQDCLEFVQKVLKEVGANATAADVEKLIRKKLANNELVFGFGHAVLRVEDARATVIYKHVQKKFPDHPLVKITKLLRSEGPKVLAENPKISDPYPNVDAISGTLLSAAGFEYPEYFTVLFGMARVVGIAIQIVYERCEARDGKGLPIVRPDYIYKERNTK